VLSKKTDKARSKSDVYATEIQNLAPKIRINGFGKFAGVLNYSKMSFGLRILAKTLFAFLGVKEGDYRDWMAIEKWSQELSH
jgi:menaquinone-dependent protoporphyrinogen IX oxidase